MSCIIVTLFLRNDNVINSNIFHLYILYSVFSSLTNSSVICSYGVIKESHIAEKSSRTVTIKNSTFSDNTGNTQLNMFNFALINLLPHVSSNLKMTVQSYGYYYNIKFYKCTFTRNTNMKVLIYVKLPSTDVAIGYIAVLNCSISNNNNVTFIKVEWPTQITYDKVIYVSLVFVNVSSNKHHYGDNLISITNGYLRIRAFFFIQNGYYDNVIIFHPSMLYVRDYSEISSNYARHIIKAQDNSFMFIHYLATINISQNVVYKVFKQVSNFERHTTPIYPFQISIGKLKLNNLHSNAVNCTLLLSKNMEMISKILPTDTISYMNNKCKWLEGTFYQKINANVSIVYHKIVRWNNTFVNETVKRLIPLSVCPCLLISNDNYVQLLCGKCI